MLTSFEDMWAKYRIRCTGIIHAGAHKGEEAKTYYDLGVKNVWWIEANPDLIPLLKMNVRPYNQQVICALLGENDGDFHDFHVTNNGMSSSMLPLDKHLYWVKDVWEVDQKTLMTRTLDSLANENPWMYDCNFLNMDLQGAELLCVKGGQEVLQNINYIYTEVNYASLYEGCALSEELFGALDEFNVVESWNTPHEWGDSLLIRKSLMKKVRH